MGDTSGVLRANETFYRAFAERDFETMDRLWARSVGVTCIHPGWPPLHGRDAVIESWRGILGNPASPRIRARGATAWVQGSVAYVLCQEILAEGNLIATNVFVREDGEWRIVHHHASPSGILAAGPAAPTGPVH